MRIYSLSCGHYLNSGTHSIGMMTMCAVCLCYARVTGVSSEWPTPNSDAIVNMVFDAIGTWNTRAPRVTSPPFDLTRFTRPQIHDREGIEMKTLDAILCVIGAVFVLVAVLLGAK